MAPRKPSTTSSLNMTELDDLMKEYPDWKEQFPQLYEQANPPRYNTMAMTICGIDIFGHITLYN